MKPAQNEQHLQELAVKLRKKSMTARQIAQMTGCSKPIAYARVKALIARGHKVVKKRVREGKSGPKSVAYMIAAQEKE